jgi:GTP cyclohydrolase I
MAGLNPSLTDGARPRPALLVANEDPASDEAVPVVNRDGMRRAVDPDAVERAAADFLAALGIDLDREERRATPARMARAYAELLAARPFRLTTFPTT